MVIDDGHVITGFSVSTTVTICVQVAVFPALSVAVHVTVVVPKGKVVGASLLTVAVPQLSVAVATPIEAVDEHCPKSVLMVIDDGHVITGFSVSTTVTICVQVAVFPALSVAVHVTVVVPKGKVVGASLLTVAVPQLSVAVATPIEAVDEHCPKSVLMVIDDGHVITGFSVSTTVTTWVQVAVFPALLVTVHVTVVPPIG